MGEKDETKGKSDFLALQAQIVKDRKASAKTRGILRPHISTLAAEEIGGKENQIFGRQFLEILFPE